MSCRCYLSSFLLLDTQALGSVAPKVPNPLKFSLSSKFCDSISALCSFMNLPHFRTTIFSNPVNHPCRLFLPVRCYFRRQTSPIQATTHQIIPARDRVIDFGKYKGRMLGTLPSSYLSWVSKNLRARDFEEWAKLADQVLQDPIYNDRMEWEFADNVLTGNRSKAMSSSGDGDTTAVSELMEISERFGWDNNDKAGWSKINFELLGTSKGGRIPRLEKREEGEAETLIKQKERPLEVELEVGERRRKRRERQKKIRKEAQTEIESDESEIKEKDRGSFANGVDVHSEGVRYESKREMGQNSNPFPGREALLRQVINRRRFVP